MLHGRQHRAHTSPACTEQHSQPIAVSHLQARLPHSEDKSVHRSLGVHVEANSNDGSRPGLHVLWTSQVSTDPSTSAHQLSGWSRFRLYALPPEPAVCPARAFLTIADAHRPGSSGSARASGVGHPVTASKGGLPPC